MIYTLFIVIFGIFLGQEYNLPIIKDYFLQFMYYLEELKKSEQTPKDESFLSELIKRIIK